MRRVQLPLVSCAVLLALLGAAAHADETPAATIKVSSATAGSNLGERLVEGVMSFRGRDYLLRLRNVTGAAMTEGSVYGLLRASDIEGSYTASDEGLRNSFHVTIRFDPPLETGSAGLKVELAGQLNKPKLSGSERESGAE